MLHVDVARRDPDSRKCREANQHRIRARPPPLRVMQSGYQEHDAKCGNRNSLKDAQRARLQTEVVLRVQGVGQERNASQEATEIRETSIF